MFSIQSLNGCHGHSPYEMTYSPTVTPLSKKLVVLITLAPAAAIEKLWLLGEMEGRFGGGGGRGGGIAGSIAVIFASIAARSESVRFDSGRVMTGRGVRLWMSSNSPLLKF